MCLELLSNCGEGFERVSRRNRSVDNYNVKSKAGGVISFVLFSALDFEI